MPSPQDHIDQLKTQIAFEKAKYKELAGKVKELLKVQVDWKKYKRAELFYKKCQLEKEILEMINPNKVSQAVLDWQGK